MNQLITQNHTLTMSSREIADSVLSGNATDAQANKLALDLISTLLGVISACADAVGSQDRDKHNELLELSGEVRTIVLASAGAFGIHHPECAKAIKRALRVAAYAEATTIPALFCADTSAQKGAMRTYIVMNSASGLLKIGRTSNPEQRIKALETGAGLTLKVCAVIPGDRERELHRRFAHLRVFGEWFRDDGSVAEFIAQGVQL